jgi:FkbM family methyltransferase
VDPTPRAVSHFDEIVRNLGRNRTSAYTDDGRLLVDSYDLRGLSRESLTLVRKALWNQQATLKFFEPVNSDDVSHSIINFQNDYRIDTSSIEVDAITVSCLLSELGVDKIEIPLIKLDIEGAEIEVITDFLQEGFRPLQILVEFDELNRPTPRAFQRVTDVNQHLQESG